MRALRVLLIGLVIAALYVPSALTQTRRGQQRQQGAEVQMPRRGAVSMIGVRLSDVTADNMKTLKVSRIEGAVVEGVNPNSPAATAGLHEKDVIVQFDGERVRSASHLTRLVNETPAGREVTLTVVRDGRRSDLRIKPEAGTGWFDPRFGGMIDQEQWREYADQAGRAAREMSQNLPDLMPDMRAEMLWGLGRGRLGATVQQLTPELAEYFGVKSGLLVTSVAQDSPAGKAGMKAGDVITAADGKSIASPGDLLRALPARDQARDVSLTVVRDKKEMTLTVSLAPARQQQGRPI